MSNPPTLRLYRTPRGPVVRHRDRYHALYDLAWDALVARDDLLAVLVDHAGAAPVIDAPSELLAPVVSQEVWAAGVTYWRSRAARMEESKDAGGGSFYDRVYSAERPELFFKALGSRVIGPRGSVRIRKDSKWNVPEPELTLLISAGGKITGYTCGNDMSSRDIEGENPLYLPQAKVYDGSCAIGPCVLVSETPPAPTASISIRILRGGAEAFVGSTTVSQIKRELPSLVEFLYRENTFPSGCLLMTGTGVIPPDAFTLALGDVIDITIEGIGTLQNTVAS
jgi:2-dehydro-3-deoxy-D-arabinonate dehydratase